MSSCSSCSGGSAHRGSGAAALLQDTLISSTLSKIHYKLFIMSGKGGVGKSSVTVNAAAALASKGFSVGILDVDIHGPSVPRLLNLSGHVEADERGGLLNPVRYNERLAVISMDSLLRDRDSAILWRGPKKTAAIRQFISGVNWGELDFLLIDSPPGTGDEHMTVLKTIPDALCVIVTTPQEISLADVRKAVNFLQYAKANVFGVVENMSGLHCPHCRQEIELFKKGGGRLLAAPLTILSANSRKPRFAGKSPSRKTTGMPLSAAATVAGSRGTPPRKGMPYCCANSLPPPFLKISIS